MSRRAQRKQPSSAVRQENDMVEVDAVADERVNYKSISNIIQSNVARVGDAVD